MRPIYDWDIFQVNPWKDILYSVIFIVVAICLLIISMAVTLAFMMIDSTLIIDHAKVPYDFINTGSDLILSLLRVLVVSTPIQIIIGIALKLYKKEREGWL